jgi:hypothetical protein
MQELSLNMLTAVVATAWVLFSAGLIKAQQEGEHQPKQEQEPKQEPTGHAV